MPPLAATFNDRGDSSKDLVRSAEVARVSLPVGSIARIDFSATRLEFIYELAYLQIFIAWEIFLEETLLRYMCGYQSQFGQAVMVGGHYFTSLPAAAAALYGGQPFLLWHNPHRVVKRCKGVIQNGRHEAILSSSSADLEDFASIRHRISHGQDDARQKFDAATMRICGQRYRGSRPGRFLRDWVPAHSGQSDRSFRAFRSLHRSGATFI
jgi:hypothetical protein